MVRGVGQQTDSPGGGGARPRGRGRGWALGGRGLGAGAENQLRRQGGRDTLGEARSAACPSWWASLPVRDLAVFAAVASGHRG
jgi:hypothetical protein